MVGKQDPPRPGAAAAAKAAAAPTPTARSAAHARSIDRVLFATHNIKTWYFSPYPLPHIDYSELNPGPSSLTKRTGRPTARSAAPSLIPLTERLFVCEACFKYQTTYDDYWVHRRDCKMKRPPGRKVYQRGAHTIWEIDGAKEFDYCLNLCLFGKLFIDHKTLYFDVDPFYFYVVTNGEGASDFDRPYGYFSKEKVSYDDYNLACIVTFPPYQRKGWGAMMIEFSYYISALSGGNIGTPERPLSDLGLKGYLSYWTSVLLRTLALGFLSSHDKTEPPVLLLATTSLTLEPQEVRMKAALRIRRLLLGLPAPRVNERPNLQHLGILDENGRQKPRELWTEQEKEEYKKVRRAPIGWAGEVMSRKQARRKKTDQAGGQSGGGGGAGGDGEQQVQASGAHGNDDDDDASYEHPLLNPAAKIVSLSTTLERLSIACNLRTEDLAFAMAEIGLLRWRIRDQDSVPFVIPIGAGAAEKENTRTGGLAAAAELRAGNPAVKPSKGAVVVARAGVGAGAGAGAGSGGGAVGGIGGSSTTTADDKTLPPPPAEVGVVLITKEQIWAKIMERQLKKPVLDEAYILY